MYTDVASRRQRIKPTLGGGSVRAVLLSAAPLFLITPVEMPALAGFRELALL